MARWYRLSMRVLVLLVGGKGQKSRSRKGREVNQDVAEESGGTCAHLPSSAILERDYRLRKPPPAPEKAARFTMPPPNMLDCRGAILAFGAIAV